MSEWRSWTENPPQIPWHPVMVTFHNVMFPPALIVPENLFQKNHIDKWKPTGLYRQEMVDVTGEWV